MKAMLFLLLATTLAAPRPLFDRYESVRQALLRADVKAVHSSAAALADAARGAKLDGLTAHAAELARASDIRSARASFAIVSRDMIAYRNRISGSRPAVLYCSMEKKSWLQPAPSPVGNPYLDASMRSCGEVKDK